MLERHWPVHINKCIKYNATIFFLHVTDVYIIIESRAHQKLECLTMHSQTQFTEKTFLIPYIKERKK